MAYPKAYKPEQGYRYHLLCRHPEYNGREWEHCDHARDLADKNYLLGEYRMSYTGFEIKAFQVPRKYWGE